MKAGFTEKWRTMLKNPILGGVTLFGMASSVISRLIKDNNYYIVALISLFVFYLGASAVIALLFPVGKSIEEKAWEAYERGKLSKAKKLIDKAREKAKGTPMQFLYMIEGKVYQAADMVVEAIAAYENAVQGDYVFWWYFEAYFQLGQLHDESAPAYLGKAIEAYLRAVDIGETMLEIDADDEGIKQAIAHGIMPEEKRMFELCHSIAECYEERSETGDDENVRVWLQKEMDYRERNLPPEVESAAQKAINLGKKLSDDSVEETMINSHLEAAKFYMQAIETLLPHLSQLHPRVADIYFDLAEIIANYYYAFCGDGIIYESDRLSTMRYTPYDFKELGGLLDMCEQIIQYFGIAYNSYKRVLGNNMKTVYAYFAYARHSASYVAESGTKDTSIVLDAVEKDGDYIVRMCQELEAEPSITAAVQLALCQVYKLAENYNSAIQRGEEAKRFFETSPDAKGDLISCLTYLGSTYAWKSSFYKAADYTIQAMFLVDNSELKQRFKIGAKRYYEETEQSQKKPFETWVAERMKESRT